MPEPSYKFYQNKACKYFPCHKGLPEEEFNCLFCWCPLFMLGHECGGDFEYLPSGAKSCLKCTKPHGPGGYEHVLQQYKKVVARINAEGKAYLEKVNKEK